jgi:hypothetical protein
MLREFAVNLSDRRIGAPLSALTFFVRPPHKIGKIIFVHGNNLLAALPATRIFDQGDGALPQPGSRLCPTSIIFRMVTQRTQLRENPHNERRLNARHSQSALAGRIVAMNPLFDPIALHFVLTIVSIAGVAGILMAAAAMAGRNSQG